VRKYPILIALSLSLAGATAALAQAPAPAIAAGAVVKDTNGGEVGTILRVEGPNVVLKTDKHEVRLPASSFAPSNGAFLFGMTRDQVNAAVEKSLAAAAAKIAPGAAVSDPSGAAVGTLTAVDADTVTVKLTSGTLVRVPRTGIAPGTNGVVVGATAAQLEASAKAATPAPPGK
jgi:preprotein translocase subunit YajC